MGARQPSRLRVKRRTSPTKPNIDYQHHLAFEHAATVFKGRLKGRFHNRKAHHNRKGERIRFTVDLEFANGDTTEAEFSRTQGFRMTLLGSPWDDLTFGPNKPSAIRKLEPRLRAYREAFIRWNQANSNQLSFRSFNLVLAALAYDQTIPS